MLNKRSQTKVVHIVQPHLYEILDAEIDYRGAQGTSQSVGNIFYLDCNDMVAI